MGDLSSTLLACCRYSRLAFVPTDAEMERFTTQGQPSSPSARSRERSLPCNPAALCDPVGG